MTFDPALSAMMVSARVSPFAFARSAIMGFVMPVL